ncbi:amino acid transporter [Cytidiella melzeri]|nr:amino acid transporter [Cytidiella melzeri]
MRTALASSSRTTLDRDDLEVFTIREDEPLLNSRSRKLHGSYSAGEEGLGDDDERLDDTNKDRRKDHHALRDDVPHEKRQLGLFSASFLIFNRVIGTGIFATPSVILRSSGSVGLSLVMWLLGATVAACGTAVYIELGAGLPRSGGEKNYLDFIYRRPKFLAVCVYAAFSVLNGWESASTSVFGECMSYSTPICCITFAFILHSTNLKWGLRVQNVLGATKLFVLVAIAVSGLGALFGMPGFRLDHSPENFKWTAMWEGSGSGGVNAFITGLYSVIWSFIGYSNANYALSEIRDPVRTIKVAAPLAMISITFVYMLVNIAYYAVVDKQDILDSGRIIAALFFGKLWGVWTERILGGIVAISSLGNVMAVLFTQGRVIQELGREGILPFSSFFGSNKPYETPMGGLFSQWFTTSLLVASIPPGDAYLFMLNASSYPLTIINTMVSGGLLFLHSTNNRFSKVYVWNPPFRTYYPAIVFFFISNIFLVFAPLIPPAPGFRPYEHLPYWLHVSTGFGIGLVGVIYWYVWYNWLPRWGGYKVVRERTVQEDGVSRNVVQKVYSVL